MKEKGSFVESLGSRIRTERRERRLTLEDFSQKTELSKSFLSQIERGLAQPSISSLKRIAREFDMSVVDLFSGETKKADSFGSPPNPKKNDKTFVEEVQVVRAGRRKSLTLPGSNVSYDLLTPDLNRHLEVMFMKINPGENSGEEPMIDLPGEKFGLILKGMLEASVGKETYRLSAGDSIYFPAHFPHSWRGLGQEPIEVIWVLTPPRF